MKHNYVENFVNPRYYVNLDFDNLISYTECEGQSVSIPRLVVSVLMLITMFVCIVHLWWIACVLSALLAFFSFPKTSHWLQNVMKVVFPNKFFWLVTVILLVATALSIGIHKRADDVKIAKAAAMAEQQRQAEIAEKLEKERAAKEKEQQRLDSLSYHLNLAKMRLDEKKTMAAAEEYVLALQFADHKATSAICYKIANIFFAKKQYDTALKYYSNVMHSPARLDTLRYNRAVCYIYVGNIAAAASELHQSIKTKRVEALFNKINPVKTRVSYEEYPVEKKRVSHYTILCRDGSYSHSTSRRGTCSHHGGVADWSHPVYETYTDYQKKKVFEKYREYGEL